MSPILQIVKLCKTKDPSQVSELIFIVMALNASLWFVDFYRNFNFMAILPQAVGLPLNLIFFSIFIAYKYRPARSFPIILSSWVGMVTLLGCLIYLVPRNEAGDTGIAMTAMVVNIMIAFTPMQKLPVVFKSGDYTIIPVAVNLIVMFSSVVWGGYAILLHNLPLLVPQVVIIALCLITMGVYCFFRYKGRKAAESKDETRDEKAADKTKDKQKSVPEAADHGDMGPVLVMGAVRKQSVANEASKGSLVIKIENRR